MKIGDTSFKQKNLIFQNRNAGNAFTVLRLLVTLVMLLCQQSTPMSVGTATTATTTPPEKLQLVFFIIVKLLR